MIHIGKSDLVWQPDIRVSTFPSGLVLVQRSAVCRATDSKRSELAVGDSMPADNTPAMDGLYIFPEPQETRDAPFTTYQVSAYGRSTDQVVETVEQTVILGRAYEQVVNSVTYKFYALILGKKVTQKGVCESGDTNVITSPTASSEITGTVIYGGETYDISTPGFYNIVNQSRTNYGSWDEYVTTWELTPLNNVITFAVIGNTTLSIIIR